MQIISASRRTDIPAFYSDWFMNRIRAGYAVFKNPFSGQPVQVDLNPDAVHSIVFWTKDAAPLVPHLPELERRGYGYTVLYTITAAPQIYEPQVPVAIESCEVFKCLVEHTSPRHISWRFDPILISSHTPPDYWLERFSTLAQSLAGHTDRCITSFAQFYGKVKRRLKLLEEAEGITFSDPSLAEKRHLLQQMAAIADGHGISLQVCCDDTLVGEGVEKAHCVDGTRLAKLFPDKPAINKLNPTRDECGCTDSRDIGAYDTCAHGCVYCYANTSPKMVAKNAAQHDPHGDSLIL
jgi:DNA repair photolyase